MHNFWRLAICPKNSLFTYSFIEKKSIAYIPPQTNKRAQIVYFLIKPHYFRKNFKYRLFKFTCVVSFFKVIGRKMRIYKHISLTALSRCNLHAVKFLFCITYSKFIELHPSSKSSFRTSYCPQNIPKTHL